MVSNHWEHLPGFRVHPKGASARYKAATEENPKRLVLALRHATDAPNIWPAPTYYTEENGILTEELDLESTHFPNGSVSLPFFVIPHSNRTLPFAYRVFIDPGHLGPPPLNKTIAKGLKCPWLGHVVIARYARGNNPNIHIYMQISRQENEIVSSLLACWFDKVWANLYGHVGSLDVFNAMYNP
ncbi:hypothetical protein DFP72DRAFT_859643 [Ephemerocybe angulata]|uniref:Uncharacterized protein n=1 Tax=Ephemerocybe angulata TaxID=980116 RepID=A0A8H6LUC0_9AGAR|nr:hypothetical protein DFP72DRAFT_859643 [Tulosesus angulatus]